MTNHSTALVSESKEPTLIFIVYRIIALAIVLRNSTMKYGEMCEICTIPHKNFHDKFALPPGELSIVAEMLFDLVTEHGSDIAEASNEYMDLLKAREEADNGDY